MLNEKIKDSIIIEVSWSWLAATGKEMIYFMFGFFVVVVMTAFSFFG